MARALLIYYSQSGTTAQIAQNIAAGISAGNWEDYYLFIEETPVRVYDERLAIFIVTLILNVYLIAITERREPYAA